MARLAMSPAAAVSLMPSFRPRARRGLFSSFVSTSTRGKAPASTMAMVPTVRKPSEMGAMPGRMAKPVSPSTMARARPRVATAATALPNREKPRTMAPSARHSPRAMRAARMRMGVRFPRTIPRGQPAATPPTNTPRGMVTMPLRMPLAMAGRSSSRRMPMATGMVKTMVAPSMEPVMTPPRPAALGSSVRARARGPPPMSQARMDPANMAGSAPRKR